jgi:heme A synthase
LAGYIVGCCVIALAVGMWIGAPRLRWLGVAALLAVIVQGLLGGYRVRLNELVGTDLAAVHGFFAALVFSLIVSTAVLTSNGATPALDPTERRRFGRLGLVVVLIVVGQLGLGALLQHKDVSVGPRLHLLGAFVVVGAGMWLARAVREKESTRRRLGRSAHLLMVFLTLQVLLGVEAWLNRFSQGMYREVQPHLTPASAAVRTAHFLLGSAILATTVTTFLLARLAPAATPNFDSSAQEPPSRTGVTTAAATAGLALAPRLERTA